MADISLAGDQFSPTLHFQIGDDSPLAHASLKSLNFSNFPIISDINKPLDQFSLEEVQVGIGLAAPAALIGDHPSFGIGGGTSGTVSIRNHSQQTLFDSNEFAPALAINEGECWAALSIGLNLQQSFTTPPSGFGFSVFAGESVSLGTLIRFPLSGCPMPSLKDGLVTLVERYSVPTSAAMIRATPLGVAHTTETTGSLSLGPSYTVPLIINPLATLGRLNLNLNVAPNVMASISGTITLEGSFVIRIFRSTAEKLVLGVYKKRQTSVRASLSGMAGVGVDSNSNATDILAKVLNAIVPRADLSGLELDVDQRRTLQEALRECVDQSLSLAVNACCASSESNESALVYELDVSGSDLAETDKAIESALRGDWSKLEDLSNARRIRNVVRDLHERKHKITFNVLGLYNAMSISDYLKSTTVLLDEHGQIALVDQVSAQSLSAGVTPYSAKSDKLRAALAQSFVATITYGALKDKLGVTAFTVRQSFLEYHSKATVSEVTPQVLLARAFDLACSPEWEPILKSNVTFSQNKFYLDAQYSAVSALHLFYQDVENRIPHSGSALDRIGRNTKIQLLDPSGSNSPQRRAALANDEIWGAMTSSGNVTTFKLIPGLAKLNQSALAAISADFLDIRWWSDALQSVCPKLTAVLSALEQSRSPNPMDDAGFMAAHQKLEQSLSNLTSKTHSAFADGWPLAVMYQLAKSSHAPSVQMDIGLNGKFEHYESGMAVGHGT